MPRVALTARTLIRLRIFNNLPTLLDRQKSAGGRSVHRSPPLPAAAAAAAADDDDDDDDDDAYGAADRSPCDEPRSRVNLLTTAAEPSRAEPTRFDPIIVLTPRDRCRMSSHAVVGPAAAAASATAKFAPSSPPDECYKNRRAVCLRGRLPSTQRRTHYCAASAEGDSVSTPRRSASARSHNASFL